MPRLYAGLALAAVITAGTAFAWAQTADPHAHDAQPQPATGQAPAPSNQAPQAMQAPPTSVRRLLSDVDAQSLTQALAAAKRGDVANARMLTAGIGDPLARKIAAWALVDSSSGAMSFFELDQARRRLSGILHPEPLDGVTGEECLRIAGLEERVLEGVRGKRLEVGPGADRPGPGMGQPEPGEQGREPALVDRGLQRVGPRNGKGKPRLDISRKS